jgi:hypothetical protein
MEMFTTSYISIGTNGGSFELCLSFGYQGSARLLIDAINFLLKASENDIVVKNHNAFVEFNRVLQENSPKMIETLRQAVSIR